MVTNVCKTNVGCCFEDKKSRTLTLKHLTVFRLELLEIMIAGFVLRSRLAG